MERSEGRGWVRLRSGLVEVWENPDVPFAVGADAFARYAARGDWVLLFNALTLSTARLYAV
jgi:hypothetical protein